MLLISKKNLIVLSSLILGSSLLHAGKYEKLKEVFVDEGRSLTPLAVKKLNQDQKISNIVIGNNRFGCLFNDDGRYYYSAKVYEFDENGNVSKLASSKALDPRWENKQPKSMDIVLRGAPHAYFHRELDEKTKKFTIQILTTYVNSKLKYKSEEIDLNCEGPLQHGVFSLAENKKAYDDAAISFGEKGLVYAHTPKEKKLEVFKGGKTQQTYTNFDGTGPVYYYSGRFYVFNREKSSVSGKTESVIRSYAYNTVGKLLETNSYSLGENYPSHLEISGSYAYITKKKDAAIQVLEVKNDGSFEPKSTIQFKKYANGKSVKLDKNKPRAVSVDSVNNRIAIQFGSKKVKVFELEDFLGTKK